MRGPHRLVVRVIGGPRPQALVGVEIHGVDFLPANLLQCHSCLGDSETDDHEQRKHKTEQEAKQCMRALCMSACLRNGTSFRAMLFNLCLVFTRMGCKQLQVGKKQNYRAMRRCTGKDRCHNTEHPKQAEVSIYPCAAATHGAPAAGGECCDISADYMDGLHMEEKSL